MNPVITGAVLGNLVPIAILVCAWLVASALMQNRTKREAERLELHVKLLERAGSARELGEFLSSPAGERFLRSLSPEPPPDRVVSAVRTGAFMITFGLVVLVAGVLNVAGDMSRNLAVIGVLVLAYGVASLTGVAVSRIVARRLGITIGQEQHSYAR